MSKLLTELERFLWWLSRLSGDEKRQHSAEISELADDLASRVGLINPANDPDVDVDDLESDDESE